MYHHRFVSGPLWSIVGPTPRLLIYGLTWNGASRWPWRNPGKIIKVNKHIVFLRPVSSKFLYMGLPSGRRIAYPYPEYNDGECRYMAVHLGKWMRTTTYGGKLTENAVQGIARDVLVDAMSDTWVPIVFHVHDEIVVLGDEIKEVTAAMECPPAWAEDLPLAVDAHYVERFKKL